jgi:hypothetical protein
MRTTPPLSEGVFLYVLGIVIVASQPHRFWFGFGIAIVPLVIGPLGRAIGGERSNRA